MSVIQIIPTPDIFLFSEQVDPVTVAFARPVLMKTGEIFDNVISFTLTPDIFLFLEQVNLVTALLLFTCFRQNRRSR